MSGQVVIAIDGPAGSGKSTLARALSSELELSTLDTGATYRAMAAALLDEGIDPTDADAVGAFAERALIDDEDGTVINDRDYSDRLRTDPVNQAVSLVAASPRVRNVLASWQRRWSALHGGGVIEGRDIGTTVFPEATIKLYLTASTEVRARRRPEEGLHAVKRRDHIDSTRQASPLSVATDAWQIDTTDLAVGDIVAMVVARLSAAELGGGS